MDMTEICVLVAVVEFIFCEIKQETGRGGLGVSLGESLG